MRKIATGEIFSNFIENNRIFVDKTKQIYSVLDNHDRIFLSRPRRFGKSTILDTIGTLFEHGVEPYFKDTWIYNHWDDKTYPVLRLNFLTFSTTDFESFSQLFCSRIADFANEINLEKYCPSTIPSEALFRLLNLLRQESRKIVILVDEYDAQLTANINNPELYEKFRACIRELYGVLKGQYAIKFLGITGVTRLKDTSIFSVGSDILDISFDSKVASITGFTKDEIRKYYHDYLVLTASLEKEIPIEQVTEEDTEAILDKLADEYDGYSFDEDYKVKVFNTWSVNKFFGNVAAKNNVKYGDYWYDNGGVPSILANYLQKRSLDAKQLKRLAKGNININYDDFLNPVSLLGMDENILMSQVGYLTLKSEINIETGEPITLGISNKEVRRALFRLLTIKTLGVSPVINKESRVILEKGSADEIVGVLNTVLNSISYDHNPLTTETIVRDCLHCYMLGCGLNAIAEANSINGRADLRVDLKQRRLVFEFKYGNGSTNCATQLNNAITQLNTNNYGNVLPIKDEILSIALVFDGDERKITHWQKV